MTDWNNKKEVLAAVKQGDGTLESASKELKADKEVVLAAVKAWGYDLENASKELKADKEVVLVAIQNSHGSALEYASEELRADKEVVLAALNQLKEQQSSSFEFRIIFNYASKELKNDPEFMKEVEQYL